MANRLIYKQMVSVVCMNCHEVLVPRYRRRLSDIGDPISRCPRCGGHGYNPILREVAMHSPEHVKSRQKKETFRVMFLLVVVGWFLSSFFSGHAFARFLPLISLLLVIPIKPWDFSQQMEESMQRLKDNPGRAEEIESYGQQAVEEGSAWDLYRREQSERPSGPADTVSEA